MQLEGLGSGVSSLAGPGCELPSGSGRSQAAKQFLVHFALKSQPLVTTVFRNFCYSETRLKKYFREFREQDDVK